MTPVNQIIPTTNQSQANCVVCRHTKHISRSDGDQVRRFISYNKSLGQIV